MNLLQRGQALEAENRLEAAIAAYDAAIALVRVSGNAADPGERHALGLAWMNRGNALQKVGSPAATADAVRSYDEAIALFRTLPLREQPLLRNHLGAAWLNRGHALMLAEGAAAIGSFERAVAELEQLPLKADPFFRLNLAGAHTNLAHALLPTGPERAAVSARAALRVLAEVERQHEAFAAMSLRARRALVMALGALLALAERSRQPTQDLAAEATDAVDDGLALAAALENDGLCAHRPLAARLFRLGAQLYGGNQPHFLGEFVSETLATPGFGADAEFRHIAAVSLEQAVAALRRGIFVAGTAEAEQRLATLRSIRAAQEQLSALGAQRSPPT